MRNFTSHVSQLLFIRLLFLRLCACVASEGWCRLGVPGVSAASALTQNEIGGLCGRCFSGECAHKSPRHNMDLRQSGRVLKRQDMSMSLKTEVFCPLAAALAPLGCSC